jgi:NitT/TauT family transport system substrate-binding protein
MPMMLSRRHLLTTVSLAGAVALIRAPQALAVEGAPETTTVRIFANRPGICVAPQYVANELLRAEGFTDVRYVGLAAPTGLPAATAVASGDADFTVSFAAPLAIAIDGGAPITLLSGVHVGCFELFGNEGVRSIADLKGKSVGVQGFGSSQHVYTAAMAAYVGLDPTKDIHWAINPSVKPTEPYEKGQIDAFLGFPPEPQDLRARHIGHVVVNSAVDRTWSQYFCCMLAGNHDYVRKHPVATKRVLRAILKATDLCLATRSASRGSSSTAVSLTDTTMRCRRSASCLTTNGANTTPRTLSGSTHCACMRRG